MLIFIKIRVSTRYRFLNMGFLWFSSYGQVNLSTGHPKHQIYYTMDQSSLMEQFWSIMHQQIIWLDIHTDHGPLTKQKVRLQRANHGESKKMSPWAKLGQSTDHQSHMYIGKKKMIRIQFTVPIDFIKRKRAYIV